MPGTAGGRAVISAAPASPAGAGGKGASRSVGAGVICGENITGCARNCRVDIDRRGAPAVLAVITGWGYGDRRPDGVSAMPIGALAPCTT